MKIGENECMNYGHNNNIRVFYEVKEGGSPRSVTAEKPKNPEQSKQIEQTNKIELENFSKKALGGLLLSQNKGDAIALLREMKKDISKIDIKLQKNYITQVTLLEQWINGKSLFTDNGEPKKIGDDIKKQIASGLGLDYNSNIEVQERIRIADVFRKKYPIEKYKNELIDFCLTHPKIAEYGSRINEERVKIQKNGGAYLPEYNALIETLAKITTSELFDKMTGTFSKTLLFVEGKGKKSQKYEENLRLFLNDVVSQKKPLEINSLNLSSEYISIKDRTDIDYNIQKMRADLKNYEGKEKKLDRINQYIAATNANQSKLNPEVLKRIQDLQLAEKATIDAGPNEGMTGKIKDILKSGNGQQDTVENFEIAKKIRDDMQTNTGIPHFTYFDKSLNKYEVKSIVAIGEQMLTNIQGLNIGLIQTIMGMKNWTEFFERNLKPESIAAIGLYAEKKADTRIFTDYPNSKEYFIQKYRESINAQEKIFANKKLSENDGKFEDIFPKLHKEFPNLGDNIRKSIKDGNLKDAYGLLIQEKDITGTKIRTIMRLISEDSNNLMIKTKVEVLRVSKEFEGKTLKELKSEFKLEEQKDIDAFKRIEEKKIQNGELSQDERLFLINRIQNPNKKNPLYTFLNGIRLISHHATIQGKAAVIGKMIEKNDPAKKPNSLTTDQENIINNGGELNKSLEISKVNTSLGNQNSKIAGIEKFDTIEKIRIELQRLGKLKNPNQEQLDTISMFKSRLRDQRETAIATTNFVNSPGLIKEDSISILRDMTGTKLSDKEIEKWIDSQKFISTYVTEKDFIETVEKNAAYMDLNQTKSIGDLYENSGKVNVSNMSSDTGSVRLGETNIGLTTFNGMNDLMNCRVELGDNGVFSRTIRSPEGDVIAENIPLRFIDDTIEQLGRFYSLGLGSLAPYMENVGISISKSRPDGITGLDGYNKNEDIKFLKILAIMLYGEESLPKDMNIPNLVQLFNRTGREYDPKYILMQKGILQETGGINTTRLDTELQNSSKKVA